VACIVLQFRSALYNRTSADGIKREGNSMDYRQLGRSGVKVSPHREQLKVYAEERGITAGQFAVCWVLNNQLVTGAIAGPRTEQQWDD
jgi:aryl-alcohol dehydrogenase-like predicted oxidoreductase